MPKKSSFAAGLGELAVKKKLTSSDFLIILFGSLTQKKNQYVWMLMARYPQVVQSRKMLLALGLYKQYLYYVVPIARLQGRL